MKKLFKLLRLSLGLFTRKELRIFAQMTANRDDIPIEIWSSDVENFIHDLKQ